MIEATISQIAAAVVPIIIGAAGIVYGLAKRIQLKEAISLIQTIHAVTDSASEGGKEITVDEKIRIADEVIQALKK